jgi:hypothetical protein
MNTFTGHPAAAQALARQTIAERVQDAERRRIAKAIRAERRAAAQAHRPQPVPNSLPRFRFLRPAH